MHYVFKRKTDSLIKISNVDNEQLILKLNTITNSSIYESNNKKYVDIKIDYAISDIMCQIYTQSLNYLQINHDKFNQRYKNQIQKENILTIKIDKNLTITKNEFIVPSNTLKISDNIESIIELDYIWINKYMWGFVWKTKYIKILNH